MKILFYTPVQLASGGGCERWHCDITNSLKKQFRVETEIISANFGKANWSRPYVRTQLGSIPYTTINFPILFGILIPTPSIFLFLLKKFKEADTVHFIHGFAGQDIMIALLKLFTGKKVIVGHHAPIFHSSMFHNFYMRYIARHVLRFFDFHQTLNSQDRELLQKKWKIKNVYFIPSGVRIEKFLRVKHKIHNELIFLSVGRYSIQKGYDLAVEAISRFNKKFKHNLAKFLFVGNGELKNVIRKYAKQSRNIVDLGFIPYEKMPGLYARSDIFLLPSREEPFGLVLIEAWASGIPVLATRTEGPKDMLKPDINGWFIEALNEDDILNGIINIYKNYLTRKSYLDKFELNCRRTAKLFSIDTTAKRMQSSFFK